MRNHHRGSSVALRLVARALLATAALACCAMEASAQVQQADTVIHISLTVGRSYPLTTPDPITRIAVADPDVADAIVVSERDLVFNGKKDGETDVVLWSGTRPRLHYRISVRPPSDRKMILLAVRLAEVRRDVLRELGVSSVYRDKNGGTRGGTGLFNSDAAIGADGKTVTIPSTSRFLTILSDFGTNQFLGFIDTEEQNGRARLLAEPNLLTANRDTATFLAGGEIPIPVLQNTGTSLGSGGVTIQYREFGVRLRFTPEILGDSIIKLYIRPEVSSLDYSNALLLNGFRVPALRTRRVESTVDIRRDQSVILSGLFNDEREIARTGIPFLMDIPILGNLFSSTRWQTSETELLVVVTPRIVDPNEMEAQLLLPIQPDSRLPAKDAIQKRLPGGVPKKP